MKRLIAMFIIATLMTCSLSIAAETAAVMTGTHETASPGEKVTIVLSLHENPGLASWKVDLTWDQNVLQLDTQSISLGDDFVGGMFVENTNEDGKLCLVWAKSENVSADGNVVTLTFTVSENAESGIYPISVAVSGTRNENGGQVAVTTYNASITLPDILTDSSVTVVPDDLTPEQTPVNPTFPTAFHNPFTDLKETLYYYQPVMWALENGITTGTSTTTFSPNQACNRAQTVTFLWRTAGSPEPSSLEMPFFDVAADSYYYKAVQWAVENEITTGTSPSTFSPNAVVTRAQTVTFLWRAQNTPSALTSNPFDDVAADTYYTDAVLWAVENGITTGTSPTTFSPTTDCSRAQIVTFLYRYMDNK